LCRDSEHVQLSMFDESKLIEVVLPENQTMCYALCLNPVRAEKETTTRRSMVEKAKEELDKIATRKRCYTMDFIIELLKNIQKQLVEFKGIEIFVTSEFTNEQQIIFYLLNIKFV